MLHSTVARSAGHTPAISVCLPNLNNRQFLQERLESIFKQSCADWELIVVDGHSDDGAWEFLQENAAREPRMRLVQAPREGIYPAINRCIELARGEFVYIATSDDTMPSDCLQKLAAALHSNPDCDLAHCMLWAEGLGAEALNVAWRSQSIFARSSGELLQKMHVRRAPLDGLLHLYGESVYLSLTQLLIRRRLFDRVGYFDGRWQSIGDFHWVMRAGLVANTVHVPDTWGGWRLHSQQATHGVALDSPQHRDKIEEMIDDALVSCWSQLPRSVRDGLESGWRDAFRLQWEFQRKLRQTSGTARSWYLLRNIAGSRAARTYLLQRLNIRRAEPPSETVSGWLRSCGLHDLLRAA